MKINVRIHDKCQRKGSQKSNQLKERLIDNTDIEMTGSSLIFMTFLKALGAVYR